MALQRERVVKILASSFGNMRQVRLGWRVGGGPSACSLVRGVVPFTSKPQPSRAVRIDTGGRVSLIGLLSLRSWALCHLLNGI